MPPETNQLEFKAVEGIPYWASYRPNFATDSSGKVFMKNGKNSSVIYRQGKIISPGRCTYECTTCNSEIQKEVVMHDIEGNGGDAPVQEEVPYCPKCQQIPLPYGCSIKDNVCSSLDAKIIKNFKN